MIGACPKSQLHLEPWERDIRFIACYSGSFSGLRFWLRPGFSEFRDMRIAKRRIEHGANLPTFTALILDLSDIRDLLALADVLVRVFEGCDSKVYLIDGSV